MKLSVFASRSRVSAATDPAARGGHRIADIELLRGLAVLFVIVQHAHGNLVSWPIAAVDGVFRYFQFSCGVDLFFAISGFVIARSLVPMLGACGTPREVASATLWFWVRRAWRLVPSAWLWLALILVASALFNRSGLFGSVRTNLDATVAAVFDFANFRFAEAYGHFPYGASFPFWSLSLEEQFYLLFPIMIFLSGRWLPAVLALGVLAQLFIARAPVLMAIRTDALMLGVLIALWSGRQSYRPAALGRSRAVGGAVLVGLLALLAWLDGSGERFIGFSHGLIALVSATLVLIASFDGDYLMGDGMIKRALLWVGGRSYGLYLLHVPVMFAVRELWLRLDIQPAHGHGWAMVLVALALMVVLAELNFRLVEAPLRARGARIADRRARRPAATVLSDVAAGEPAQEALQIVG